MIEVKTINEIASRIAEKFNPEKIILFGSYASGCATNDSDLDFIVIQETNLPRHKRSFEIQKMLLGSMIPIDILVYTKSEFEQEKDVKHSFINTAIKTSKLLYERN